MKILFIGEYSNVYTELSKELKRLGHSTFCISDGDGFKNYPTDYLFKNEVKKTNSVLYKSIRQINYRLGLAGIWDFLKRWQKVKHLFSGYDIVQLINPVALTGYGSIPNLIMLHYVKKHNKNIFMSVLGDDYYVIEWFRRNERTCSYYNSDNFKNYLKTDVRYRYHRCFLYKYLNDYAVKISKGLIPGLGCYKHAYDWTNKVSSVVPFPLSADRIAKPLELKNGERVIIFHGWQKGSEKRKGNDIYDKVLKRIAEKYGDKVEYNVVQSVPFNEYIKLYNSCHIFIDQLYFPEYGYNALLGMAAGKVVFSGYYKTLMRDYPSYNGEVIGVSASSNEEELFSQFCNLIENVDELNTISRNAIDFVKNNHILNYVANLYLKEWGKC